MGTRSEQAEAQGSGAGPAALTLVFVGRRHCGPSRRMESLVAWIKVTQKKHLRVVELDADQSPELAQRLGVRTTPTLVLLRGSAILRRLEGRATGRQIEELIGPFVGRGPARAA